ncbi:MAG: hypothetical protein KAR20_23470 [Candidatus Heimdallarchaeota archaeon]|nr:hypothetical protein [Candidatus Heimdallarchaeota archaeon]
MKNPIKKQRKPSEILKFAEDLGINRKISDLEGRSIRNRPVEHVSDHYVQTKKKLMKRIRLNFMLQNEENESKNRMDLWM